MMELVFESWEVLTAQAATHSYVQGRQLFQGKSVLVNRRDTRRLDEPGQAQ